MLTFTPMGRIYKNKTEADLAELLHNDDRIAFEEIHTRYFPMLYRHAMGMLADHDLVQDALQDVFVIIWEKREELHFNSTLKGYLYATTRHSIIRKLSRSKNYVQYLNSLEKQEHRLDNSTENYILEKELREKIEDEINLLPKKMQAVFRLSQTGEYTYHDLSQKLNIAEQTVKNQVLNAKKILFPKISQLLKSLF